MTALNLIVIIAGAMLAAGLLTVLAWLIYSWYLDRVEHRLARRKGLYRELVSDLATRDRALLHPTIHQISTLYDLDALEAVLEEQARSSSGRPGWLLEVYDELGLVDKYIQVLRSAHKWRDRAFAAELLGRVGGAKAVPALLETVVNTRTEDSDVREVALRALARIADPRAVEPLIRALENAEVWLAPRIADILARHGDAVVAPLIAVLNEANHRPARAWAANVLGEVRAQRAFPSVVRLLDDPEDEVRGKAATALGRIGDRRAVGHLVDRLLSDPTPFVRARISVALGQLGGPEVIERLVRALGDPAWWVRMRTVEALEHVGGIAEGPLLIALDDSDPEIRIRAAVALERLGVPDNLVRMIESGERVPDAMQTMVKFAAAGPREFLSELAQHDSRQVRSALVTAVERTGRGDLGDDLIRMASSDSEAALRARALTALRLLGIRDALPAALSALADDDQQVRAAAVELVGEFGSTDILGLLHAQTADPDPRVRAASIQALARLGAPVGEADVRRLLGDPDWTVREAAVITATNASLRSLLPDLVTVLSDTDPRVRRRAAGAVGILGDASTVPLLLAAFPDPSSQVSEAIALAVSRLEPDAVAGLAEALVDSPDVESKLALIRTVSRSRADPRPVLHRLRVDPSPAVRAAALDGMARRSRRSGEGAESIVPALESGIRDPDELVRATAVDAWSRQPTVEQPQLLLTLLEQDPSPLVRERAALSIALLRISGGNAALTAAARRAEPANVRGAAALAAGVYDHESIVARIIDMPDEGAVRELLRERLKWDSRFRLLRCRLSKARHLELHALMTPNNAEAQATLAGGTRRMLDAGDRVRLIGSLRAFSGEPSREALLQMARSDPIPEVRTAALAGVADLLEEQELLGVAGRALGDPSVLVRRAAVELFARARPRSALLTMVQALKPDDDPAVLAAAAALAEEHFDEFASVVRALASEGERAILALRIARYVIHPDLADLLPPFARSESPDVRDAVTALWRNRPDLADPASLKAVTEDPDTSIRRHAAGAALASGRYDLLRNMTDDPDPTVRREVALALGGAESVEQSGIATLELLASDGDMSVRAAAYVARLLQGMALALPPELDTQMAAEAIRESADLSRVRQTARISPFEEQRLAAALALALVQDDVAHEVARTDPAPAIRHRVAGALELSGRNLPAAP
jgi:HEAT repeat protein